MFKIICVTNRGMCGDFISRIGELYRNGIQVILREKDLSEQDYKSLAKKVLTVCPDVILHSFTDVAKKMGVRRIHLPLHMMNENMKNDFDVIGVSIHSPEEALRAEKLGATYLTAGHIFDTDCKKGLAPRGPDFLKSVKNTVKIPVYAIGGISPENIGMVQEAGADGACIMSGFMKVKNIEKYLSEIRKMY